jgi:transcriptional regulator with XRE-family HTH domain
MPPEEVEKLVAELSAWCEAKYGRQSELADKLGVSKQLVANWLENEPTIKAPIAAETLGRLSRQTKRSLAEFEASIDTKRRDEIASLPAETDFDKLWVPLIAFRIYEQRFNHCWNAVSHDPRFPNFRKASLNNMLALASADCTPADTVTAIVYQFGPLGYDAGWIIERLA